MANNDGKYAVKYGGQLIALFDNRGEAVAAVDLYEEIDRDAGVFAPDMYEIMVRVENKPTGFVYITN